MLCVQGSWKDLSFPIVQAVPEQHIHGCLKKLYRFLTYRRKWKVMEDYAVWSDVLKTLIIIPEGFIFDGASVPKIFHSILGPTGLLLLGACPHDFGYRYSGLITLDPMELTAKFVNYSKQDMDNLFEELCAKEGLYWPAWIAKKAVSIFGRRSCRHIDNSIAAIKEDFPDFSTNWCLFDQ